MSRLSLESKECGVDLRRTIDPSLPIMNGDAVKLQQAVTNIISSAIRFASKGGRIEVNAETSPAGGACVTIADDSAGMSEDEMALLLTPFLQIEGSRCRMRGGTGFELAIGKAIIELHGAEFKMVSNTGKGTAITIAFPAPIPVTFSEAETNAV